MENWYITHMIPHEWLIFMVNVARYTMDPMDPVGMINTTSVGCTWPIHDVPVPIHVERNRVANPQGVGTMILMDSPWGFVAIITIFNGNV